MFHKNASINQSNEERNLSIKDARRFTETLDFGRQNKTNSKINLGKKIAFQQRKRSPELRESRSRDTLRARKSKPNQQQLESGARKGKDRKQTAKSVGDPFRTISLREESFRLAGSTASYRDHASAAATPPESGRLRRGVGVLLSGSSGEGTDSGTRSWTVVSLYSPTAESEG